MQSQLGRGAPLSALRLVVIVGIVFSVVLPLVPLLVWSVSHRWWFPNILPTELSWRAWAYVTSPVSRVGLAFGNSLLIAVLVTVLSAAIGVPAGRALGLYRFRGKAVVEFLLLAPLLVPGLAVIMGIHVVFIRIGLVDTLGGVVLVHLLPTVPYMTIIMRGVFSTFDSELEEQAYSLGAGRLQTLCQVTLPSVLPGIMTGGLLVFLISWSQYILTLLVGGGRVLTLPVLLFSFAGAGDNAVTAALSVIFVIPAIIILVVTSRYLTGKSGALSGLGKI